MLVLLSSLRPVDPPLYNDGGHCRYRRGGRIMIRGWVDWVDCDEKQGNERQEKWFQRCTKGTWINSPHGVWTLGCDRHNDFFLADLHYHRRRFSMDTTLHKRPAA